MNCNLKWLSLYLDGELSQRKRDKLERHLQVCEACAEKVEEMKVISAKDAEKLEKVETIYFPDGEKALEIGSI